MLGSSYYLELYVGNSIDRHLVKTIAQKSQNIKWKTTVNNKKVGHKLIRHVNLDQFYALVIGEEDAFYQMCMVLPTIIQKAVDEIEGSIVPHATVIDELKTLAKEQNLDDITSLLLWQFICWGLEVTMVFLQYKE